MSPHHFRDAARSGWGIKVVRVCGQAAAKDHPVMIGSSVDASTSTATWLMDELHGKNETPSAALSNQPTFHALHGTALDAHPLTCDEARIRLRIFLQKIGAQKLYLTIRHAERLAAVADQLPHPRSAQHLARSP